MDAVRSPNAEASAILVTTQAFEEADASRPNPGLAAFSSSEGK
jgi:hypothetical protein